MKNNFLTGMSLKNEVDPRCNFENLYVGNYNTLVIKLLRGVLKGDVSTIFYIRGPAGTGKTHAVAACANYILKNEPSKIFFYGCVNLFCEIFRNSGWKEFEEVRIFFLEDVCALEEDDSAQKFFLEAIERLCNLGIAVVITSRKSPAELKVLEKLKDRLEGGLVAALRPPQAEDRKGILRFKLKKFPRISLTEDFIDLIATKVSVYDSAGRMEKILKKLVSAPHITEALLEKTISEENRTAASASFHPPPPEDFMPPPEVECPFCGREISYIKMYQRWFCYKCRRYAPPDFGKKFRPSVHLKAGGDEERVLEELRNLSSQGSDFSPSTVNRIQKALKVTIPRLPKGMTFVRKISCAFFYPQQHKVIKNEVISKIVEIIYKNSLHITFSFVGTFKYDPERCDCRFFEDVMKQTDVKFAFIVGPFEKEGVLREKIGKLLSNRKICVKFFPFEKIKNDSFYLTLLLDFATYGKAKIEYKLLKEEFMK